MTEYDYSPEAYERYMATQNRIAKWVDNTQQHPQRNPFTPTTPAPTPVRQPLPRHGRDDYSHHSPRESRHRSQSTSGSGRHGPARPRTAPPREDVYGQQYPQNSKHSNPQYSLPPQAYAPKPSRSRSSSHHSSSTRPPSFRSQTYGAPPPLPPPPPSPLTRHPVRSNTSPAPGYIYPGNRRSPLVVDTGAGYVVVPPKGKHVEVVSPQSYHSAQQPFPAYQSPTRQQPLLKRLLTGLTGGSKHSSGGSSRRRSRRSSF